MPLVFARWFFRRLLFHCEFTAFSAFRLLCVKRTRKRKEKQKIFEHFFAVLFIVLLAAIQSFSVFHDQNTIYKNLNCVAVVCFWLRQQQNVNEDSRFDATEIET